MKIFWEVFIKKFKMRGKNTAKKTKCIINFLKEGMVVFPTNQFINGAKKYKKKKMTYSDTW